jgi:hypothetical protein
LERFACFLVWGVWFPSRVPLEGTNHVQEFLGHNQWPVVPSTNKNTVIGCALSAAVHPEPLLKYY